MNLVPSLDIEIILALKFDENINKRCERLHFRLEEASLSNCLKRDELCGH